MMRGIIGMTLVGQAAWMLRGPCSPFRFFLGTLAVVILIIGWELIQEAVEGWAPWKKK